MGCPKYTSVGGQALIEGIMMKGKSKTAMAVRTPSGEIDVEEMHFKSLKDKCVIFKWPIIRGIVAFVESLLQGYKALMISAEKSGFADEENENGEIEKPSAALWNTIMVIAMVLAVVLCVGLFIYLPAWLFDLLNSLFDGRITALKSIFEGILKMGVFVAYIALVGSTKDIKRVFSYHGAEHKTIFCLEKGQSLSVENIKKQSRFHPRCGTSFMILMLIVSIVISSTVQIIFPVLTAANLRLLWTGIKLVLVPLIMGLGYELIKICGRYDNLFTKIISAPGMWMQRLTTKEPQDDMIEIAIAAIEAVLEEEDYKSFYGENYNCSKEEE